MKLKEKKTLLGFLNDGQVQDAIEYIKECTRDTGCQRETAQERNLRWAMSNNVAMEILNLNVGESRIVRNEQIQRKTLSCVIAYAYRGRKYKLLNIDEASYLVARVK